MNGRDIFDLANRLVYANVGRSEEARIRSIVSRAYYAAYHVARETLIELGGRPPLKNDDAHAHVYRELHNCANDDVKKAAELLNNFKTDRNHADYRLELTKFAKPQAAVHAIERADTIIKAMDNALIEPARGALESYFKAKS